MEELDRDLERSLKSVRDGYRRATARSHSDARVEFFRRYHARRRRNLIAATAVATTAVVAIAFVFVSTHNTADQTEVAEPPQGTAIALHDHPVDVATGDDGFVWVSESGPQARFGVGITVAKVDPSTNEVVDRAKMGAEPGDIAVGLDGVWVAQAALGRIVRLNPDDLNDQVHVNVAPEIVFDIEITIGSGYVWAVADGEGLTRVTPDGSNTEFLDYPDAIDVAVRDKVWLLQKNGTILVLDPATMDEIAKLTVPPSDVGDIAFGNDSLWYGTRRDGKLIRLDPDSGKKLATVELPGNYSKLAIDTSNAWALSVDGPQGWLTPIDRTTAEPLGPAVVLDGTPVEPALGEGSLWVAQRSRDTLLRLPKDPPER